MYNVVYPTGCYCTLRVTVRLCSRINLRDDFRFDFPFGSITSTELSCTGAVGCPLAFVLGEERDYDQDE